MNYQTTIASPVSISGKGLHTGQQVTVTLEPAPANSGIQFMRTDIPGCPIVKAIPENVFDTSRGTAIKDGKAEVYTIEHLMAALSGLSGDGGIELGQNKQAHIVGHRPRRHPASGKPAGNGDRI